MRGSRGEQTATILYGLWNNAVKLLPSVPRASVACVLLDLLIAPNAEQASCAADPASLANAAGFSPQNAL